MKNVYELLFITKDNVRHNLIYSSKKRALNDLDRFYYVGAMHCCGEIVKSSIVDRVLF